jgi:ribose transport system substrate-binding protein
MKTGFKQLLAAAVLGGSILGLAACNEEKPSTTPDPSPDKKEEITIGMSFPHADHGWMGAVIKYAKDEGKNQGVKVEMTTAPDPSTQANNVDDLITKQPDAIVMLPHETDALTPAAKTIQDAGIPLVVFDREVNDGAYTSLIKGDNVGIGENAATFIGEKLNGEGKVVIISAVPSSVNTQRLEGFTSVVEEKYPNLEILAEQNGEFTREKGYEVMQNFLTAHQEIDAVYTLDDEMALGALQAIEEAERQDIKIMTGAGGNKEFYGKIKDSESIELATFTYSPLMIKEAVKKAVSLAKGEEVGEKDTTLPAEKVSKENIDAYYNEDAAY